MASCNLVIIMGNLGKDPDLRHTQSGVAVASFSVACNRVWWNKKTEKKEEEVTWVRVTAWNKLAEHCNTYLKKGRGVHVTGRLRTYEYDDAKTGEKRYGTDVVAQSIQFLPEGDPNKKGPPHPADRGDEPPEGLGGGWGADDEPPF